MKSRHAAALALVGWYLISPQILWKGHQCKARLELPIARWNRSEIVFSSDSECEDARSRILNDFTAEGIIGRRMREPARTEYVTAITSTFCARSDDPHLKER
jgi:hypothetical protein